MGASKKSILDLIPSQYLPNTILVDSKLSFSDIQRQISEARINYPMILKPDIGERGLHVQIIRNDLELRKYLDLKVPKIIIQEFLDMPFEAGIFYYRFPNQEKGTISSVVVKELLTVEGDGVSTLKELISEKPRAKLQLKRLESELDFKLQEVLAEGEKITLEPIGNHNRGTAFLDGNHLINDELIDVFDGLSKQIKGFFYGRFDLRCDGQEALYKGQFKIMELNGVASEPAHIYSPNYPILKGYKSLFHHWKTLFRISVLNHQSGIPYMSWTDGMEAIRKSRFV